MNGGDLGDAAMQAANDINVLKRLRAQGVDTAQRNGATPMLIAAWVIAVQAMEWLKAQGAAINAQNSYDQTPMHLAV